MTRLILVPCLWLIIAAGPTTSAQRSFDSGLILPPPKEGVVEVVKGLVFKEEDHGPLTLDLYHPAELIDPLPVVVFVNGGRPNLKDHPQYRDWARYTAASGLIGVTYESRSMESAPLDTHDVLDFLAEEGEEHGVLPDQICLWACSGNVSTGFTIANDEAREDIRCAVIYYGAPRELSPVRSNLPLLIAKAGRDNPGLNQRIDNLVSHVLLERVPLTYLDHAFGVHGFDLIDDTEETRRVLRTTMDFMRTHLSDDAQREVRGATLIRAIRRDEENHRWTEVAAHWEELVQIFPRRHPLRFDKGLACLQAEMYAHAIDDFVLCAEAGYQKATSLYNAACAAALEGDQDLAIGLLERSVDSGYRRLAEMRNDSDLESLRSDPRFRALTRR